MASPGLTSLRVPARQFQPQSRVPALAAVLTLTLLAWWLLLGSSGHGSQLVRASYDSTLVLRGSEAAALRESPVALVYLDLHSYTQERQDPGQPFDRRLHAKLVRRLTAAGARAVVFDILFESPSADPAVDAELAAAMRENGRVILGAEWHRSEQDRGDAPALRQRGVILPATNLIAAAAAHGFTFAKIDPDLVVRELFAGFPERDLPSLTWATARWLGLGVAGASNAPAGGRWLNYYGPPLTVPNVSFSDALDPRAVPDEFLRGKVVLIGARPAAGQFDERRDEWRNPYAAWSRGVPFLPAVEVHATQMLNLLRGDWLRRLPVGWEAGLLGLTSALCGWGLLRLRPLPAAGVVLGGEVLLVGLVAWGATQRLWFPWLIVAAVQLPGALLWSLLVQSVGWFRQRRHMLAKIREQAALIDKARDAIVVTDLTGQVTYANPRATQLYAFNAAELTLPAAGNDWLGMDPAAFAEARRVVLAQGEWSGELRQRGRDGTPFLVESRWTLIRDERGQPKELLLINTDITEKKRLEEQFLRAQRLEAVGALASGMAHDLNNVLSPVLMGVQLLKRKQSDEETQRMLEVMESHAHRGADMVKQVLLFSRGQTGDRTPLDVGELLHELERMLRQTFPRDLRVSVLAPADLWPVLGQPTQLHQVLLNLCVNARDAMPGGGELNLAADNVELAADEAARLSPEAKPGRYVMLLVSDTGAGMTPEVQARLFEPFFSTKPAGQGTGLGLPTTALLVRQHGGFMVVKSELGVGTDIEVYLPACSVAPPAAKASTRSESATPGKLILVAGDDQAVCELLRQELTAAGYAVLTVASAGAVKATVAARASELGATVLLWPISGAKGFGDVVPQLDNSRFRIPCIILTDDALPPSDHGVGNPVVLTGPNRLENLLKALHEVGPGNSE
jgi:PAS domain S-box-containing protein